MGRRTLAADFSDMVASQTKESANSLFHRTNQLCQVKQHKRGLLHANHKNQTTLDGQETELLTVLHSIYCNKGS